MPTADGLITKWCGYCQSHQPKEGFKKLKRGRVTVNKCAACYAKKRDHKERPAEMRYTPDVLYTYKGHSLTAMGWAKRTGMAYGTLRWRLERRWPIEKALMQPVKGK